MALASSRRPTDVDHRRLKAGQPHRGGPVLNLANGLTTLRMLSVVPIVLLVEDGSFRAAFWLFVLAGSTDLADGLVARHYAGVSRLGGILDPVADKLLLVGLLLVLAWHGIVPSWLLGLVVLRDVVLAVGTLVLRARLPGFEVAPSFLGKASTFSQLVYVGAILANEGDVIWFASDLALVCLPVTAVLTAASGCAYVAGAIRLTLAGDPRP